MPIFVVSFSDALLSTATATTNEHFDTTQTLTLKRAKTGISPGKKEYIPLSSQVQTIFYMHSQ
jgi:hypothetical protein